MKSKLEMIHLGIEFAKTLKADNESYLSGAGFGYSCGYEAAQQSYASQSAGQGSELFRWVKASERLPEDGGYYFVMAGPDKALWTRSRLVARTEMLKQENAENHIEWLEPLPVSPSKPTSEGMPPTDNDIRLAAEKYLSEFALDYPPGNATCFAAGVKWALQQIKNQNG